MAKEKIAGKVNNAVHAALQKCWNDYSTQSLPVGKRFNFHSPKAAAPMVAAFPQTRCDSRDD
jgi:hypothetical protein